MAAALTLRNLTLAEGSASSGGAIRLRDGARVTGDKLHFTNNSAGHGGAIATASADARLTIQRSSFEDNRASGSGGAIVIDGGSAAISGSAFWGNVAESDGGAVETLAGAVDISNSTFSGNEANHGGGIYTSGGETTLTHVTLTDNVARYLRGAGVYGAAGRLNLRKQHHRRQRRRR